MHWPDKPGDMSLKWSFMILKLGLIWKHNYVIVGIGNLNVYKMSMLWHLWTLSEMQIKNCIQIPISIQLLRRYATLVSSTPYLVKTYGLDTRRIKCWSHLKSRDCPRRLKKGRHMDPNEKISTPKGLMKSKWQYSRCNEFGQNTRTCTNEPILKKPKGKLGRPRKTKKKKRRQIMKLLQVILLVLQR